MIAAALGWIGTTGTFAAYLLLARGRLGSDSLAYSLMNVGGGVLGGAAGVLYGAWPSVASNAVWALVGLHSTAVTVRRRIRSRRSRATTAIEALREPLADCLV